MSAALTTRLQTALVLLLFVGSLAVVMYVTLTTLALPQRELQARDGLRGASGELAEHSSSVVPLLPGSPGGSREALDRKLREIANRVLEAYPGVEGGFYVAREDRFSGYAYPTSGRHVDSLRNEPPPLEAPIIRRQAQQSLDSGQPILRTEDVESSRVIIMTGPVGDAWPAPLATWVLFRLTGPELL
jgi:hypothetical protein